MRTYEIFLSGDYFGALTASNQADARFKVAVIVHPDYLLEASRALYIRRRR